MKSFEKKQKWLIKEEILIKEIINKNGEYCNFLLLCYTQIIK